MNFEIADSLNALKVAVQHRLRPTILKAQSPRFHQFINRLWHLDRRRAKAV